MWLTAAHSRCIRTALRRSYRHKNAHWLTDSVAVDGPLRVYGSAKHEDCAGRGELGMTFNRALTPTQRSPGASAALRFRRCFAAAACRLFGEKDIDLATYVEQTEPADVLYNQGLANLKPARLKEAGKKFEAVDRQHPYSE